MNKKLTLSQTVLITLFCVAMIWAVFSMPALSILTIGVSALFAVIATLSDNKGIFVSIIIVILSFLFITNPANIFNVCLNFVMPGVIMGIITKEMLNCKEDNEFSPIFMGTIAFIVGLIGNYLVSKYLFNIDVLKEFNSVIKTQISSQMDMIRESVSSLGLGKDITEESIMKEVLNIMPLLLFLRAISLAIVTYFIEILTLKKIKKGELKESLSKVKFSRFYLPGNAVLTSFVIYIVIMLLGLLEARIYTDLILVNLELIFYVLFLIQGVSVAVFFVKKWFKSGKIMKFLLGFVAVFFFGIMGIAILGMVDSVFDFRKIKNCELI